MKFTTTLTAAIITCSAAVAAFPTQTSPAFYYYPATNSLYHDCDGEVDFDFAGGNMTKVAGGNEVVSTLVYFKIDNKASNGKICEFSFQLGDAEYTLHGQNPLFDIFWTEQGKVIEHDGFYGSSYRGEYMGKMAPVGGANANSVEGSLKFMCPDAEGSDDFKYGFEVVPASEDIDVRWTKIDGPWIRFYDGDKREDILRERGDMETY